MSINGIPVKLDHVQLALCVAPARNSFLHPGGEFYQHGDFLRRWRKDLFAAPHRDELVSGICVIVQNAFQAGTLNVSMTDATKGSWRHGDATLSKPLLDRLSHVQSAKDLKVVGGRGALDLVDMYPLFQVRQLKAAFQVGVCPTRFKASSITKEHFQVTGRLATSGEGEFIVKAWSAIGPLRLGRNFCLRPLTATFKGELVREAAAISKPAAMIPDVIRHAKPTVCVTITTASSLRKLPSKYSRKPNALCHVGRPVTCDCLIRQVPPSRCCRCCCTPIWKLEVVDWLAGSSRVSRPMNSSWQKLWANGQDLPTALLRTCFPKPSLSEASLQTQVLLIVSCLCPHE